MGPAAATNQQPMQAMMAEAMMAEPMMIEPMMIMAVEPMTTPRRVAVLRSPCVGLSSDVVVWHLV
jgi:hypothetical protein